MERGKKPKSRRTPLEWKSFPYWYLLLMLVLLWLWQGAFTQFSVQTIAYSEFKERLRRGEVIEAAVKETTIDGKINPKPGSPPTQPKAPTSGKLTKGVDTTKPFFFRTVRVED